MMKDSILKISSVEGVPVRVKIVPTSNGFVRTMYELKPTSITIHETGNFSSGANAEMHSRYLEKLENFIGWHFTVDEDEIYQHLPLNEVGYHTGNSQGNFSSIGIEMCVNQDGNFEKTKENTRKLVQYLMRNYPQLTQLYPHKKWNGKWCPATVLNNEGWESFSKFLLSDGQVIDYKTKYLQVKTKLKLLLSEMEELK